MICSICGSDKITRSHRRGMEKLFKYVYPRAPYRCKECWSRFWIFENPFKTNSSKVIAGFAACLLIFLISWPFLPFNKKEPVKVEKKKESGSLFLGRHSDTPKSGSTEPESTELEPTENDSQEEEDAIASYDDPESVSELDPLIQQGDTVVSVPETSLQETKPEIITTPPVSETQPDTAVSSLSTGQLEKKKNAELETKSQFVEVEPLTTKKAEPVSTKPSTKLSNESSVKQIPVPDKKTEQKPKPDIKPDIKQALQFKGIKISESQGSVDILLKIDKMKEKHKYFFITNPAPPRIVIDLPGKWSHKGDTVFKTKSNIINQVRVGKHPDFFRIVLDMKTKKRLFPSFKDSPEGLLISVKK